jgi:hypothetical protein
MRSTLLGSMFALALCIPSGRTDDPTIVKLWPGKAPGETAEAGEEKTTKKADHIEVTNIISPTMVVYRPENS